MTTILYACMSTTDVTISPIATFPTSPSPRVSPTVLPYPVTTQSSQPLPTLTPVPTATPIPQPPVATDWLTYTHAGGVSVQYPANWQANPNPGYNYVDFGIGVDLKSAPNYWVRLDIYHRPAKDRAITNPYTWQPRDGNDEVHWAKPISIDAATGLEFVWGDYYDHRWDIRPTLNAIYYSETYELDIRLSTFFDDRSIELIETIGFTETISSRFGVFEHMVQSVKINP